MNAAVANQPFRVRVRILLATSLACSLLIQTSLAETRASADDVGGFRVAKKYYSVKGWRNKKYGHSYSHNRNNYHGGPGAEESQVDAGDDHVVWAADQVYGFIKVFTNDHTVPGATIYWLDSNGEAELGQNAEGEWGFWYYLHPAFNSDGFPYRIAAPDNPEMNYADADVHVNRQAPQNQDCPRGHQSRRCSFPRGDSIEASAISERPR